MEIVEVLIIVVLLPFFFYLWGFVFLIIIAKALKKAISEKFKLGKKNKKGKRLEDAV